MTNTINKLALIQILFLSTFFTITGISSSSAVAQSVYVSDKIFVPLRSGQTNKHRIVHRGLPSGAQLELIELSEDEKWSHIRTKGGTDGWIPNQYIQNTPTAKILLANTQKELNQLKHSAKNQNSNVLDISKQLDTLQKNYKALTKTHQSTSKELSRITQLSANAIKIDRANSKLLKNNQLMKVEIEQIKIERDKLKGDSFNKGLQLGAGILFIGLLIGFVMKSRNTGRSNSW